MSPRSYHKGRIAWDERRARHLTSEGEQALRRLRTKIHRLQTKTHEASEGLSARAEVLMGEKRAAYEAKHRALRSCYTGDSPRGPDSLED